MSYNRPTLETIYQRIKADLESYASDGVPIPRVSLLGIIGHAFAGASHLMHGFIAWMVKQNFIDKADEWGLIRWGNRYGLPRKAATYSSGYIFPTGVDTTVVPDETIWVDSEGYEFEQQGAFTIGTDVEVELVAVVAGADSNTTDTSLTLSSPIADVDSTAEILTELDDETVPAQFDDGIDLEGLEAWRLRLLQRSQSPPSSGNQGDYVRWALAVPGVGRAWCIPAQIWGTGSVGIYVAEYNMQAVPASILSAVETYIDAARPVPAFVEYANITPKVTAYWISISPNTAALRDEIEANLTTLHLLESEPGGTMKISHIRDAIMNSGVDDYEITSINVQDYGSVNPIGDYTLTHPDVAVYYDTVFVDL